MTELAGQSQKTKSDKSTSSIGEPMNYDPHKETFLGFSPADGTVDFYGRINYLASPEATYLDYGAGRGSWFEDDNNNIRRTLRHMQGKFKEVIAADVDKAVLQNKTADRALLIQNGCVPLGAESVDVIVADYVIEHIDEPSKFVAEISRLLRPGGWFCARTPHKFHYVALAEKVTPKFLQGPLIERAQVGRKEVDIFPKKYRMNTIKEISSAFPLWTNRSYCRSSDPAYFFGSKVMYGIAAYAHRILPTELSGNLFVFLQKPSSR